MRLRRPFRACAGWPTVPRPTAWAIVLSALRACTVFRTLERNIETGASGWYAESGWHWDGRDWNPILRLLRIVGPLFGKAFERFLERGGEVGILQIAYCRFGLLFVELAGR